MEGSLVPWHCDDTEFNLREWRLKSQISHANTCSRRFSASYVRSFRENKRSFRSNFTISSAASSPGYQLKDEIDPSTYSFTTALKALRARPGYFSECLSPDGFTLNSKWSDAERYICNPLSGEVPLECLSAKSLSCRSFHNLMTSRITMSAPLVYSKRMDIMPSPDTKERDQNTEVAAQEKQREVKTRDVGIQSNTPPDESSCSPSPTSTPLIWERSLKFYLAVNGGACTSSANLNSNDKVELSSSRELENNEPEADKVKIGDVSMQVEQVKETREDEEDAERGTKEQEKKVNTEPPPLCKYGQSCGYFPSLSIPWRRCFIAKGKKKRSNGKV